MTDTMAGPRTANHEPRGRSRRRWAMLGGVAVALAVGLAVLFGTGSALAASFLVTTTADAPDANVGDGLCASAAGECTLRAAIQEANVTLVADEVVVPAGTYVLTVPPAGANLGENGDLDVLRPLTLSGAGSEGTLVDGRGADRLLEIHSGAGAVTVSGLTLRAGAVADTGGALLNGSTGTVRLRDVAVRDSTATEAGGGVASGGELGAGRLELVDSAVTGNATEGEGGGIHVGAGSLSLMGTQVVGNTARGGGGVHNAGEVSPTGVPSRILLDRTTVSDNLARASGGGVANDGEGQVVVTDSTVEDNTTHGDGGGVHNGAKGGMTVTGGSVTGNLAHGSGGGAYTSGERAARIDGTTFADNVAGGTVADETGTSLPGEGGGGGLAGSGGTLTVTGATFERNTAVGDGGGILLTNTGSVQISDTAVRDNRTESGGGGIENAAGRVTLTRLEVTGNRAALDGGGIESNGSGSFTIDRTTVARNSAANGGGLANQADGTLRVVGTTIWDNRALAGGGDDTGLGGGVYGLGDADAGYENTTISGNYAQVRGGGLYLDADAGVRVSHTTISGNTAPVASGVGGEVTSVNVPVTPSTSVLFRNTVVAGNLLSASCNYALGSQGGNLEDGDSCFFRGPRDRVDAAGAGLDAVSDNGGPTLTMLPQPGSFVIDGGVGPCSASDQRGVSRPQNPQCDIGAVESEGPFPPSDTVPPETSYVSGPVMDTEATSVFAFTGSDDVTATGELLYECRLLESDPAEPPEVVDPTEPAPPEEQFVGCPNPWQVPLVEDGVFRFEVRAIDRAGNVDPSPAVHEFSNALDVTPPDTVFLEKPADPNSSNVATFTFGGTDDLTDPRFLEFECRIDTNDPEAWLECTNPTSFANLLPGSHTVQVRAIDLEDNIDPTPATYTWTVAPPTDCDAANITLSATHDAYVDESLTVENFAVSEQLVVRSQAPGRDARSLLRFGLPAGGEDCAIESATLRLHGEGEPGRTLEAVPITEDWTENGVTWNTQPGTAGTPATATSGSGYRDWDVTEHVVAMLSGAANHGWLVRDAAEEDGAGAAQTFVSSEAVRVPPTPPQLVLRFAAAGTPPPAAPAEPGAAQTVTCGQVLTESTRLADDLVGCLGEGLVVGAPDIVVDLNGHTISSGVPVEPGEEDGLLAGIRNSGHTNVTVRGGTVRGFGYGVRITAGVTYNVVEDMTLRDNVNAGVELFDADNGRNGNIVRASEFHLNGVGVQLLEGAENSVVTGNTFTGNLGVAVYLYEASGHRIEDNTISGLTNDPLLDSDGGVRLQSSSRNVIRGNTVSDTGDAGVDLSLGSHRNRVEANSLSRTSDSGVSVADSEGNEIVGNVAHLAGGAGISLSDARSGSITGNDVRFNPGGIALAGSSGVLVQDNDASGSTAGGISAEAGGSNRIVGNIASDTNGAGVVVEAETLDANGLPVDGNVIEANTANGNGGDGIAVGGAGHTVTDNAAHHNLGWGISAAEGTVDGGGNTASGNAEELQCTGVVCAEGSPPPPGGADIQPPDTQLLATPPNPSSATDTATFTFTGTDNGAPATALRFQCRLDAPPDPPAEPPEPRAPGEPPDQVSGENWVECSSGISYPFLFTGTHTFEVRAIDPTDLFDESPATFTWDVVAAPPGPDPTPPDTTIGTAPADPSPDTDGATFTFRGSDNATPGPSLRYECRLDGAEFAACTSPVSHEGLGLGEHTFAVRAIDLAGNADPSPAAHTWAVVAAAPDTTAPDTLLDAAPDPTTVATSARFAFSSDEPRATFECARDDAAFAPCESPRTYADLAVGNHTFAVRAIDAAGNADGTPATHTWTVTTAPVDAEVSCGQVLTVSTRLLNDLVDCPGDGLVIGAHGITVDLNGATIDGVGAGDGLRNDGFDAVTITGGFVQEFVSGVALNQGTARNVVSDLTVQLAELAGVTMTNADDGATGNTVRTSTFAGNGAGVVLGAGTQFATVYGNSVVGSSGFGVHVLASPGNRVEANDVAGSSDAGIVLEGSPSTSVTGNTVDGTADAAVLVELGSHDAVVRANTVLDSEAGVVVLDSNRAQILDNVLSGSSDNGVSLDNAHDGVVQGNDLRFNGGGLEMYASSGHRVEGNDASEGGTGIALGDDSLANMIIGNTASFNDAEGIAVGGHAPAGSGNVIEANTAEGNTADGVFVGAVGHMLRGNTANDNGGWGIYAAQGTVAGVNVDGGFNRAVGNVGGGVFDPVTQTSEQCFSIRCDGGPGLPTDQVAPETELLSAPPGPTTFTTARFEFTGHDNASTVHFQCRLDSADPADYADCTSPITYSGLGLGEHTFEVVALDFSGNPDPTPVVHTWTVVAPEPGVPPVTTITAAADPSTISTAATFAFSANEEGVTFECRLDGDPFGPCTSPTGYSGLVEGAHVFEVRGTDPQGDVEASPASHAWTIGPPPVAAAVTCGQTLTQSTLVTNDLVNCPGDGIVIGAAGITVDLGGHVLDGIGLGAGVRNPGFPAVSVTDGTLQEFDDGVALTGATGNLVGGLTLVQNQVTGIALADADGTVVRGNSLNQNVLGILLTDGTQDARVTGNTLSLNPGPGVRVEGSDGNRVDGNEIADSSGEGVVVETARGTVVAGNTLLGNDGGGIAVGPAAPETVVADNTITGSGSVGLAVLQSDGAQLVGNRIGQSSDTAITLEAANNGLLSGNDVRGNAGGIELNAAGGNRIERNNASAASGSGISLDGGSLGNAIVANRAGGNSGEGIYVADQAAAGAGNLIDGNIASGNSGDGISVNAAVHTIRNNTADSNDGWGIHAVAGNVDGGGNRASGNAEAQQCSGVTCEIGAAPGAPDTSIVERPPNPTNSRTALFTFTGTDDTTPVANLGFECRLDSTAETAWVECDNPAEYTALDAGAHVFEVRAVDQNELVDPTPARWEWTYEPLPSGEAPQAFIDLKPEPVTPALEALFTFSSNEPDVTFACSLDGAPFTPCAVGVEYDFAEHEVGPHNFRVQATDFEGNVGPPASYDWTILGVVTTITGGPAFVVGDAGEPASGGETEDRTATFEFHANVADATFQCSLDLGPFEDCASPLTYTNLAVGEHLLRILASDADGREELEPTEYEWTVLPGIDVTPPDTTITLGPPAGAPSDVSTFFFEGTDDRTAPAGLTFECRLDSADEADFAECASPQHYPNPDRPEPLEPGPHRFDVRAIDLEDNVDPAPATLEWEYTGDTTAPETTIATGPAAETGQTAATFTFSANDPFPAFECALDGAAFEGCDSPHEMQGLEPGGHAIEVRATDLSGNVGAPASHAWTVVGAPVTTIVSAPAAVSAVPDATFAFEADQAGSTFRCALDGAPLTGCTSPVSYPGLPGGEHAFAVQARNPHGITEVVPVEFTWLVDLPPPSPPETTITEGPPVSTTATTATFAFAGDQPDATFECALEQGPFAACTSPVAYENLALGEHDFAVRAIGADGEVDATPAEYEWEIVAPPAAPDTTAPDTTAPDTTITSGPEPGTSTTASVAFTSTEPGSFECALDGAPFAACTSPVELSGLAVGDHTFAVRAVDAAGNTDASPATHAWVVEAPADTTAPDTTITSGPESGTSTTASVAFTSTEPGSFECALDGAPFAACTSPVELSGLAVGDHTFAVRAVDAAGNTDASPATTSWTVQSSCARPGTVTAASAADSWVHQKDASKNFGSDSILKVTTKPGENTRALVRFTLPTMPAGCTVTGAELRLYNAAPKGGAIAVQQLAGPWTESGVTWSNQPGTTGTAVTTAAPASNAAWMHWNVTGQVQSMYGGGDHGFVVGNANEGSGDAEQQFHGREKGTDKPPQLVLTFG